MKNLLLATTIAIVTSSAAVADVVRARITHVEPRYETVYNNVPTTQCQDVEVPVYGRTGGGATGGDVLGGMIIGGLLGKGATGKDNGAAAGAVLGGIIAADRGQKKGVVGYRQETQCQNQTSYTTTQKEVYSHSVITFNENGRTYRLRFQK